MELVERGYDDARIAREMGETLHSVRNARRKYSIPSGRKVKATLTPYKISRIMGFPREGPIVRAIERGDLPAQWTMVRKNRKWVVSSQEFERFLANENYWPLWDHDQITDPHWRAVAERVRPTGIRYLTHYEAADRLFISTRGLIGWIHAGRVPGAVLYKHWWVPEHVIATVEPPPLGHPRREMAA